MFEPLLIMASVLVVGMIGRALLSSTGDRDRKIDAAWAEACRILQGSPFGVRSHSEPSVRSIRFPCGDAYVTLFERVEEANGRPHAVFAMCEIYGLPSSDNVKLTVRKALIPSLDQHADFDRRFAVKAIPSILATTFLDPPTRALVLESNQPFELEYGMIRTRKPGWADDHQPLVALARYGQALCERWLAMVAAPRSLAVDLGFDANEEPLRFDGITVLGQTFRRGRTWQIELSCTDLCEIVLRTLEEPVLELRFDALTSSSETIGYALEAKENELGTASAYR